LSTYVDTSFLVSLYVPDANSAEAAERARHAKLPLLVTSLGEIELANAFQLRLFRKELRPAQARAAYAAFRDDARAGVLSIKPLPEAVYTQARHLALKWTAGLGTRALDILHVAAALTLEADNFHTFDARQRRLARAAGMAAP
jgi:predicted nucleic acid-binding protein